MTLPNPEALSLSWAELRGTELGLQIRAGSHKDQTACIPHADIRMQSPHPCQIHAHRVIEQDFGVF